MGFAPRTAFFRFETFSQNARREIIGLSSSLPPLTYIDAIRSLA